MKKVIYLIVFSILTVFFSCTKTIKLDNIRFNESEYFISIHKNMETGADTLISYKVQQDSEEITFLKDWLNNNNFNWNKSVISYAMPVYSLTSGNFRLLVFENFVVLGYTDSLGKSYQYQKHTDTSELHFLIEQNSKQENLEILKVNEAFQENPIQSDSDKLLKVFSEAVKTFPNDSASLYRFYFKTFPAKTPEKVQKHTDRLSALLTNEFIKRYENVENNLKPLLIEIIEKKTLSCKQAENLVILYSDYDYYTGEALFSQILSGDENYSLVWESFKIVYKESPKDTCYIAALIELDKNIRTNAELAQAMIGFIIRAVKNNPTGFLDMYSERTTEAQAKFANYISYYDVVDEELFSTFTEMSKNEKNEKYRQAANELLQHFND